MRKILFGVVVTLLVLLVFKYFDSKKEDLKVLEQNSALIQQHIKNVGKLVVTEGHFSQVFNYKNSKDILGSYITSEKKALVVVNAEVTISYDLSQITYQVDSLNKVLRILKIPEAEVKISQDLEYYDIQADFFNAFKAEDYNQIKSIINKQLLKKLEHSDLTSNAKNRLISELSKFYVLTNALGWTLEYNSMTISNQEVLETLKL